MARRISLGRGAKYSTLVSNEDYLAVVKNRWSFKRSKRCKNIYARRHRRKNGTRQTLLLSHFILIERMNIPRPSPEHTADHIDGDTLNDQRYNLRWATAKEQRRNQRRPRRVRVKDYAIPF